MVNDIDEGMNGKKKIEMGGNMNMLSENRK